MNISAIVVVVSASLRITDSCLPSGVSLTSRRPPSFDVMYLLTLLDVLRSNLDEAGLARLYDDCCEFLPARMLLDVGGYPTCSPTEPPGPPIPS